MKESFNYNEPKWDAPKHQLPKSEQVDLTVNPGMRARILIEQAIQSFEGVNINKLNELNATSKELVTFRKEIKAALYAIVREGQGYDIRLRGGAIAYLGALKFDEATELVASIALNPRENVYVRGYATEALQRLKGKNGITALEKLINDPLQNVREKAIRALGKAGSKTHIPLLKTIEGNDSNAEIRFRASGAIHFIETGKKLERPARIKPALLKTSTLQGIVKPIGRHENVKPQTAFGIDKLGGGINLVANNEMERMSAEKPVRRIVYEVLTGAPSGYSRILLRGSEVGNNLNSYPSANVYREGQHAVILELPLKNLPSPGHAFDMKLNSEKFEYEVDKWVPESPESPVIFAITPSDRVIWAKQPFSLKVNFFVPKSCKAACLKLRIKMPKDNWKVVTFNLTDNEIQKGEKQLPGFIAAIPGEISLSGSIYTQNGAASKLETTLAALPANPISLTVTPTTSGTIGEGPAHYNSSEDKFYCYATLRITNGFPHSVSYGPTVTAKVTDGGAEKDNFSFNISTGSVAANSTRTIGVWMSFGGNTYSVFKNFGDVTIRLTLQTSEGNIVDSHVWAAMAQVKLALNFVGNFSSTTRNQLQSVVDNEASAIFEQQNLFISQTAQFEIPSTHADFSKYRDIEMDDNKDSDCTSGSDEADDLRDDWSSPNETWLDVWCVETLSGPPCAASVGGFSPVNGPTGKGGSNSGVIIKMSSANLSSTSGRNLMGIIIAHEVAHFLGLNHSGTSTNFMAASTDGTNTAITHQQYIDMTDHGFVTRFVV